MSGSQCQRKSWADIAEEEDDDQFLAHLAPLIIINSPCSYNDTSTTSTPPPPSYRHHHELLHETRLPNILPSAGHAVGAASLGAIHQKIKQHESGENDNGDDGGDWQQVVSRRSIRIMKKASSSAPVANHANCNSRHHLSSDKKSSSSRPATSIANSLAPARSSLNACNRPSAPLPRIISPRYNYSHMKEHHHTTSRGSNIYHQLPST